MNAIAFGQHGEAVRDPIVVRRIRRDAVTVNDRAVDHEARAHKLARDAHVQSKRELGVAAIGTCQVDHLVIIAESIAVV